jgi:hypothetical protein
MIQLVLPLHECADPTAIESAVAKSVATKSTAKLLHSIVDSATAESTAEPLQSGADSAPTGAALTKTS